MSSGGGYSGTGDKADLDNCSNQLNPNHPEYRGGSTNYTGTIYAGTGDKAELDNRSNQKNPNNPEYGGGSGTKKN